MVNHINNIKPNSDLQPIFSRLGYSKVRTNVSDAAMKEITSSIDEAVRLIHLSAVTLECGVNLETGGKIIFTPDNDSGNQFEITSKSFGKFLGKCDRILCIGITAGKKIMDAIETLQNSDMTKAVLFDAAASEIVDSGIDFVVSLYNKQLIRRAKKLFDKRFSPGYGDMAIQNQAIFHKLLEMDSIGVAITESFILDPQKSVIALTGIV